MAGWRTVWFSGRVGGREGGPQPTAADRWRERMRQTQREWSAECRSWGVDCGPQICVDGRRSGGGSFFDGVEVAEEEEGAAEQRTGRGRRSVAGRGQDAAALVGFRILGAGTGDGG